MMAMNPNRTEFITIVLEMVIVPVGAAVVVGTAVAGTAGCSAGFACC